MDQMRGRMDQTPLVDLRIGGDHFHMKRDSNTGVTRYFLNNVAVPVTLYLARMQHHREIQLQKLYGRPHPEALRATLPSAL
jgi:hypothetical protein